MKAVIVNLAWLLVGAVIGGGIGYLFGARRAPTATTDPEATAFFDRSYGGTD